MCHMGTVKFYSHLTDITNKVHYLNQSKKNPKHFKSCFSVENIYTCLKQHLLKSHKENKSLFFPSQLFFFKHK